MAGAEGHGVARWLSAVSPKYHISILKHFNNFPTFFLGLEGGLEAFCYL